MSLKISRETFNYTRYNDKTPASVKAVSQDCSAFKLLCPIQKNWNTAKHRLLVVCEHIHTLDLKDSMLMTEKPARLFLNCLGYSNTLASSIGETPKDFALAFINYNFFKTYHLDDQVKGELHVDNIFGKRVRDYIEEIRPTHVFVSGPSAGCSVLGPYLEGIYYKAGWVSTIKVSNFEFKATYSIDFISAIDTRKEDDLDDALEDGYDNNDVELAGSFLLGYFCKALRNLMVGFIPFEVSVKPRHVLISTIPSFDALMDKLESAPRVAIDTETRNLNRVSNAIYTIQFSTSARVGYVVPYLHPESPFSKEELDHIKNRIRAFLSRPAPKISVDSSLLDSYSCLYMFNAKFDLTQLKQQFGVRVIHWPVYDLRAGEQGLDENIKFLANVKFKDNNGTKRTMASGGLAAILASQGEDFYYTAAFSKADRGDMDNTSLNSEDFCAYAAFDVQCLHALADNQILRASHDVHFVNGRRKSYGLDFIRHMLLQMSNNIHVFSNMEHRGVSINKAHLVWLRTNESPISREIIDRTQKIYASPEVVKANKYLFDKYSINVKNTILKKTPWIFKINKPEHKKALFIESMGLEPVGFGKSGDPSLGKLFKRVYKRVPEVALLNDLEKAKKLKSSYVDAIIRAMAEGDGLVDGRLRPSYDFFPVVTGRSNSSDPSLQQIPQRGPLAKVLKETFYAAFGAILIKQDYSAHELRGWSIISGDDVLGEMFQIGRDLRIKYFKSNKLKYKLELARKGDIHKSNYNFFFGTPVEEVTESQRDSVKGVGFGAIYGRSYKTLAKQAMTDAKERIVELREAIEVKKKADAKSDVSTELNLIKELDKSPEQWNALYETLYKKFFARYKRASKWLDDQKVLADSQFFVRSPLGRRRFLFGSLTGENRIISAMQRRGMNSPIQGMGADFGHTASRLFSQHMEKVLIKFGYIDDNTEKLPCDVEVMVHDSTRLEVSFSYVLIAVHLMQWCATKGVVDFYEKYYGMSFTVYPEVEMEFGVDESHMYKWDWSLDNEDDGTKTKSLYVCLSLAVSDYKKLHTKDKRTEDEILDEIYSAWENSKLKKYLFDHYPILPE